MRIRNLDFLGFPNYEVDDQGNVYSLNYLGNTGRRQMLRPGINGGGYQHVILYNNGKEKNFKVHYLVARAFLDEKHDGLDQINHKNEVKIDNRVENIEWCDARYNIRYGTRNERVSKALKGKPLSEEHKKKIGEANKKPIIGINIKTGNIVEFDSLTDAYITLNISIGNISECLTGKRKSAGGFIWRYA